MLGPTATLLTRTSTPTMLVLPTCAMRLFAPFAGLWLLSTVFSLAARSQVETPAASLDVPA